MLMSSSIESIISFGYHLLDITRSLVLLRHCFDEFFVMSAHVDRVARIHSSSLWAVGTVVHVFSPV